MRITKGEFFIDAQGEGAEQAPLQVIQVWDQSLSSLAASTKKRLDFVQRKTGYLHTPNQNTVEVCAVFGEEAVRIQFDKEDLITLLTELP